MSKKLYEESNIQEIASTIREKNGTSNTYKVSQMAEAMSDLIGPPAYNNMILAQDTQPASEYNKVWFDTDADDEYTFPQIDDNNVSATDTWSSQKIKAEDDNLKSAIRTDLNLLDSESIVVNPLIIEYEVGGISDAAGHVGEPVTNNASIRSTSYLPSFTNILITKQLDYIIRLFEYPSGGSARLALYKSATTYGIFYFTAKDNCEYKISVTRANTAANVSEYIKHFCVYSYGEKFVRQTDIDRVDSQLPEFIKTGKAVFPADYELGDVNASTGYLYRVKTTNISSFPSQIRLNIADGFRIYVVFFDSNDNAYSNTGWRTTGVNIFAGNRFKFTIARVTENTSEIADIKTFSGAVTTLAFDPKKIADIYTQHFYDYGSPFEEKKFWYHLGMEGVASSSIVPIVIPSQSVFDIEMCARLGFKFYELNPHKTLGGDWVVTHGQNGALGHDFVDLNGNDAYGVSIASKTLAELQTNYRYRSSVAKYRTPITTLENALHECRKWGIRPLIQYAESSCFELCREICGSNLVLYNDQTSLENPRNVYDGLITEYSSETNLENILRRCHEVGRPYMFSMANPQNLQDDALKAIINALHNEGFLISTAYKNKVVTSKLLSMGFDAFASCYDDCDAFMDGNIYDYHSDNAFANITNTGSVVDGNAILDTDEYIHIDGQNVLISKVYLRIRFNGALKINGVSFTSDGEDTVFYSFCGANITNSLHIVAQSQTTVYSIDCGASKC